MPDFQFYKSDKAYPGILPSIATPVEVASRLLLWRGEDEPLAG
jgi:hypothetical protein